MSSKIRPYLELKKGFTDLFKGPARWIKESYAAESILEKPYLSEDYRSMQLNVPMGVGGIEGPRDRGIEEPKGPMLFPFSVAGYVSWLFSDPSCKMSLDRGSCIAAEGLDGSARLDFGGTPYYLHEPNWAVTTTSGDLWVTDQVSSKTDFSVDFTITPTPGFSGIGSVCVRVSASHAFIRQTTGYFSASGIISLPSVTTPWEIKSINSSTRNYIAARVHQMGASIPPSFRNTVALSNLPGRLPGAPVPVAAITWKFLTADYSLNCGCAPVEITNCCDCDQAGSATIAYTTLCMSPNTTQDISVTDPGDVPASCYSWYVEDEGLYGKFLVDGVPVLAAVGLGVTIQIYSNDTCVSPFTVRLYCQGQVVDTVAFISTTNINDPTFLAILHRAVTNCFTRPGTPSTSHASGIGTAYDCDGEIYCQCSCADADASGDWFGTDISEQRCLNGLCLCLLNHCSVESCGSIYWYIGNLGNFQEEWTTIGDWTTRPDNCCIAVACLTE